jgi:hypothetical protein
MLSDARAHWRKHRRPGREYERLNPERQEQPVRAQDRSRRRPMPHDNQKDGRNRRTASTGSVETAGKPIARTILQPGVFESSTTVDSA